MYGITETTVHVTFLRLGDEEGSHRDSSRRPQCLL